MAEFKDPEHGFEDAPRMTRPSTITADENIEAAERIVMRDRQVSIRPLAEELTIIHEIMNNHMDMKKVWTRWGPKLLIPIQSANRVDCCQELLQQSEVNPVQFFHCIVTGDESCIHHYDPLGQLEAKVWKRLRGQTPTRLRQERSAGKIMMMIFWGKRWCSAHRVPATWNHPCYASVIERLRSVIVEKGRGKFIHGVLLLHGNASIHMFTLLFDILASLNGIIVTILQILHRLVTICSQT